MSKLKLHLKNFQVRETKERKLEAYLIFLTGTVHSLGLLYTSCQKALNESCGSFVFSLPHGDSLNDVGDKVIGDFGM